MNIKLSDEEISRWICEKLEPLASLPKPDEFVNRKDRRHGSDPEDAPKYWKMMQRFRSTFEYGWQPRDMVNDPTMTLMLLRLILEAQCNLDYSLCRFFFRDDGVTPMRRWVNLKPASDNKFIGRATAEAFMLMSGYKEQP